MALMANAFDRRNSNKTKLTIKRQRIAMIYAGL